MRTANRLPSEQFSVVKSEIKENKIEQKEQKEEKPFPFDLKTTLPSSETLGCYLLLSAKNGKVDQIKALLNARAEVDFKSTHCDFIRMHFSKARNVGWRRDTPSFSVCILEDDTTPLMVAAMHGHLEAVKILIEHHANVNHKCYGNITPLMYGCRGGNIEVVRLLLQNKADVNAVSGSEKNQTYPKADYGARDTTALNIAAHEGHFEIVRLLLQHRAVVDYVDGSSTETTALGHVLDRFRLELHGKPYVKVSKADDQKLVQLLLDQKADYTKVDTTYRTKSWREGLFAPGWQNYQDSIRNPSDDRSWCISKETRKQICNFLKRYGGGS